MCGILFCLHKSPFKAEIHLTFLKDDIKIKPLTIITSIKQYLP